MTGEHEFNEVFLTDVRVPDLLRISPVGDGWGAAQTTLQAERFALSGVRRKRRARDEILGGKTIDDVLALATQAEAEAPGTGDDVRRDRIVQEVVRSRGPGPHLAAVPHAGLRPARRPDRLDHQDHQGLGQPVVAGPGGRAPWRRGPGVGGRRHRSAPASCASCSRTRANSIEGGTSEIQRNIVGERVLGLPREPDPWKGVAWDEVPRS